MTPVHQMLQRTGGTDRLHSGQVTGGCFQNVHNVRFLLGSTGPALHQYRLFLSCRLAFLPEQATDCSPDRIPKSHHIDLAPFFLILIEEIGTQARNNECVTNFHILRIGYIWIIMNYPKFIVLGQCPKHIHGLLQQQVLCFLHLILTAAH